MVVTAKRQIATRSAEEIRAISDRKCQNGASVRFIRPMSTNTATLPPRQLCAQRWLEDFPEGEFFPNPSRTMTSGVFAAFQAASADSARDRRLIDRISGALVSVPGSRL